MMSPKESIDRDDDTIFSLSLSLCIFATTCTYVPGYTRKILTDGGSPSPSGFQFPWQKDSEPAKPRSGLTKAVTGAFVCLLTRAFQDGEDDDDDDEKLVPLLDMLQHSDAPNVRHTMSLETGAVQVRARFDLEPNTELLYQYRSEEEENMPYHRFFTRFGFVPGIQDGDVENLLKARSSFFFAQKAEV